MYNSPEYTAMMNVARTYLEGFKEIDKAKSGLMRTQAENKPDTARGEKQARKISKVRAVMTDKDTGYGAMAREFNRAQPLANRKRGLDKTFKKPAVAGSEGAAKAKMGMEKPTPKRPKSRMPKTDRPGTIKKP